MSTRANIVVYNANTKQYDYWYRHYDGYPEMYVDEERKTLGPGPIPNDMNDMISNFANRLMEVENESNNVAEISTGDVTDWLSQYTMECYGGKVRDVYEPANGLQGDIEYLYVVVINGPFISWRVIEVPMRDRKGELLTMSGSLALAIGRMNAMINAAHDGMWQSPTA